MAVAAWRLCRRCERCLPACLGELRADPRGQEPAVTAQGSPCCPWPRRASAQPGSVRLTAGKLPESKIFKGIARPASSPMCERELTFSLSPPLSHSSLLLSLSFFFFCERQRGGRGSGQHQDGALGRWGGAGSFFMIFFFYLVNSAEEIPDPKRAVKLIPAAGSAELCLSSCPGATSFCKRSCFG